MKVFISWSGNRSKAVAILLSDWIKCVIQATQPWISTRDIDRGALWFTEINDKLKDITVGIVCLTQENKNKPWILFETGALAKGLSSNRVCTFLIDLKPTDLEDPLAQFNHTLPTRDSMWELVRTLNGCLPQNCLDERILEQVFSTYWGKFEKDFKETLKINPSGEQPESRPKEDILEEVLENTRFLSQRIRRLESNLGRDLPDENLRILSHRCIRTTKEFDNAIKEMVEHGLDDEEILINLQGHAPTDIIKRKLEFHRSSADENELAVQNRNRSLE